jgi:GDP-D-mannose dehydratase
VREFVEAAFGEIDRRTEWRGEGVAEAGIDQSSGQVLGELIRRTFARLKSIF